MSHYDYDYESDEQAERRRFREKAAYEFDQETHTTSTSIQTASSTAYKINFRVCVDCKALTFDAKGHRKWHEENATWL